MARITQKAWAKRHGFSAQYVQKLLKRGSIHLVEGKIEAEEADAMLASMAEPSKVRPSSSDYSARELSVRLMEARLKNETEKGVLLEIQAKIAKGELLHKEDVRNALFTQGRTLRDKLLNIPDRVASLLASLDDASKIHTILTQEIRTVLEGLATAGS